MQRKIAFPSMAPAENDFGPYRLLSRIGRGGMGVTWKAVRKDAGADARPVVIKRILPDLAEEPALIEAFVNEAHVTATLSHPNIAQVLDFGRVEGEYYFAIEFVHGRTLQALLAAAAKKGLPTLPVPIACLLTQGVLAALHYAHTRAAADGRPLRIVHRDISPDNLLIGFDGVFGQAFERRLKREHGGRPIFRRGAQRREQHRVELGVDLRLADHEAANKRGHRVDVARRGAAAAVAELGSERSHARSGQRDLALHRDANALPVEQADRAARRVNRRDFLSERGAEQQRLV